MRLTAFKVLVATVALMLLAPLARAMTIEQITTPLGLHAWLVHEQSAPLVVLNYAFVGGSSQDTAEKSGTANLAADLLDEGAGELDSGAFHERLEDHAIEMSFRIGRDYFHGTLRTLNEHRDEAFDLLHLALSKPRFDKDAVERVRSQVISGLLRDTTDPGTLASHRWWQTAFPDHPYGRDADGTLASVPNITVADMRDYIGRVFARDGLTISVVGDIDAKAAGTLIDRAFGSLPAQNNLRPVPDAVPRGDGKTLVVGIDVPQPVIDFGGPGIGRHDPDFM
ncbi:MAG TPA: pitrilysin family protein, partial [Pseudolabrys sp.]|nr:pitrilysin family protein [Pseudolabrys sp.]